MLQYFREAPPISRTLAAITFTFSLLIYTYILPYSNFAFHPQAFLQLPPELWRLITPFFLTERGIGVLWDTYFLYTYGAKLEVASPRFSQRADFFVYICFACLVILSLNIVIGGPTLASPLALAFITTSTIDSWDLPVSLFNLVTFPSQYLPYLFLLITLLITGPIGAFVHGTGVVGAHLYDLLTGLYPQYGGPRRSVIATPGWMARLWGTRAEVVRPYGMVLNANAAVGAPSAGVRASAWGVGWGKWGEGRRLGGDAEVGGGAGMQRGRPIAGLAVAGFVLVSCVLGMVFMWYRDPEGWWTTIKQELFGGDMSATGGV